MPDNVDRPIFYDPTRHRLNYYRWITGFTFLVLTVAFVATFFGIAKKNQLPDLSLTKPSPVYRSQSNKPIVKINTPTTAKINPALPSTTSQIIAKNIPLENASPVNYNPKLLGFYVNWDDTSLTSLKENIGNIDELTPEWLHLSDANGGILIDDPARQKETLDFISKSRPDLPIVPLINNFDPDISDWNSDKLKGMLSSKENRAKNIQNLLDFVKNNNFAGISIDYESIPSKSQPNFIAFMQELYASFHPLGLEVTVSIPLDDSDFDIKAIAEASDFVILMAYDEHWSDSLAGPIASQEWFNRALSERLTSVRSSKIIVALGNYGYDWEENQTSGTTYSFQDAIRTAKESEGKIALDPTSLNEKFSYYDEKNIPHQVFFLDAVTAFNQIASTKKYNVGGYALWRMGSEDPSLWSVFNARQNLNADVTNHLQSLKYGYDVDYEGEGEILKVTDTPSEGKRTLTYDNQSGLITKAEMSDFPSPYVISRWGGNDKKKIALTFDDGPDSFYTPALLKTLDKYNVKATFFVIGMNALQNQGLLRQMMATGNEIGSHTFTHPNIATISDNELQLELNSTESLFASTLGRHTLLFRPPYAEDIEPETPDQVKPISSVSHLGYYIVSMHIDPKDWSSPGVDNIVNSVVSSAVSGEGNIVLLHDSGGDRSQTVAALPRIIEELQKRDFQFVKVSDLIGVSSEAIMPKVTGTEVAVSDLSHLAFAFVNWAFYFFQTAFAIGIFLGIARFLFIAVLAIEQKIRLRQKSFALSHFLPTVSVIVPAYNEAKVIIKTVKSILKSDYPNLDIIIVDDGSTDETYQITLAAFQQERKVKVFTKLNEGKAAALNFGIEKTRAEIIVALDADTIFLPDTISKLVRHFKNPKVGAVAGNAKVGNRLNLLTRWQALEYIISQNLDRRAFQVMNCITVVPGSVGAWRRKVVLDANGFSSETLAEDADLTFWVIRFGYKIIYDEEAIAFTEAPDTIKGFIKQRFRWMYGTLQTAWKHKAAVNCRGCRALGFFAIPNIFIFQVLFPLISPFMDLTIILSALWVFWQKYHHPLDYSAFFAFEKLFYFYLFFLLIDFLTSSVAFILERKEDWKLLFWIFLQRLFYRQLMYYVSIKVVLAAIKGKLVAWGNLERKATV